MEAFIPMRYKPPRALKTEASQKNLDPGASPRRHKDRLRPPKRRRGLSLHFLIRKWG